MSASDGTARGRPEARFDAAVWGEREAVAAGDVLGASDAAEAELQAARAAIGRQLAADADEQAAATTVRTMTAALKAYEDGAAARASGHGAARRATTAGERREEECAAAAAARAVGDTAKADYRGLSKIERGAGGGLGLLLTSKGATGTAETCVFAVVLVLTIGSTFQHWLMAVVLGVAITVVTDATGSVLAQVHDSLPRNRLIYLWAGWAATLTSLFTWMVSAMGDFRSEAFMHLMNGEAVAVDPSFFTPLQFTLAAAATVVSMLWHLSADGRRLRRAIRDARNHEETHRVLAERFRKEGERELTVAGGHWQRQLQAQARLLTTFERGAQEMLRIRARSAKLRGLFDTALLLRRAAPKPSLELAEAQHRFLLRRLQELAALVLTTMLTVISLAALAAGATLVCIVGLVLAVCFGVTALWLRTRDTSARIAPAHRSDRDLEQLVRGVVEERRNGKADTSEVPS